MDLPIAWPCVMSALEKVDLPAPAGPVERGQHGILDAEKN